MESIKERLLNRGIDYIHDYKNRHFAFVVANYDNKDKAWAEIFFYDVDGKLIGELVDYNLSEEEFDKVKEQIHYAEHYSRRNYETLFHRQGHRYIGVYVPVIESIFGYKYISELQKIDLDEFFVKANQ